MKTTIGCRGIGLPGCPACGRHNAAAQTTKTPAGSTSCAFFVDRVAAVHVVPARAMVGDGYEVRSGEVS